VSRPSGFAVAGVGLLLLDGALRLLLGGPYVGATVLLLVACGLSLVPFLPVELATLSVRLSLAPTLGLGSFALLLTTVSLIGIELTELSIRLAVAALVVAAGALPAIVRLQAPPTVRTRRELLAMVALAAVFGLSFASSYDLVEPFPPPGTDWAHNLLYADVVQEQGELLVDDPYSGTAEDSVPFANPPGIGAVYGTTLMLDGVSTPSLARGIAVFSAVGTLSVYAAVAGLWGMTAGLLAAAAYSVAPIRLETMYWHGLGTTIAVAFVPLVVLAIGLMYRGVHDRRTIGLLGFALAGVAALHPASGFILAAMVAMVVLADVALGVLRLRTESPRVALRTWWSDGMTRPVAAGVGVSLVLGAAAATHLRRQTAEFGPLVSHRAFDRDWLDLDTVDYYYSWPFLALVGAALLLVLWSRERRGDPALRAIGALALASLLVSQLWRVDVAFEYRRVVYFVGIALVTLVGVAAYRLGRRGVWIGVCAIALIVVTQDSIGLRLPERLLEERAPRAQTLDSLAAFRAELDREDPAASSVLVADRCLGVRVPYAVRRLTLVSAEEWQAGYEILAEGSRDATAVVEGGPNGRRLARERGVDFVLADPSCHPDLAERLGGEVAFVDDGLIVVDVREA
jgi:hypothetical protein